MNGSIGIEVQVDLQDIAYEAKWLNHSDAVDLVVSIDEARADLEFTKAMYNYFRQALIEEGALKKDERTERVRRVVAEIDRKSTRLNSSHVRISYAVFCLKKKKKKKRR